MDWLGAWLVCRSSSYGSFGFSQTAMQAWYRRNPYRRDVVHRHLEYSFQYQAPSRERESRLSRQSGKVGIFVIFGRHGCGTCGPANQLNHSSGAARRKVSHHRPRTPMRGCASPLVNNFGGTIRVGIGHHSSIRADFHNSQQYKPLRSFLNVFNILRRVLWLQELFCKDLLLFSNLPRTIATLFFYWSFHWR